MRAMAEASLRNLIPPKPGEVRNPKGNNQYTYKREFEEALNTAFTTVGDSGEPVIVEFARQVVNLAKAGDKHMMTEALARLWPVIKKVEGEHRIGGEIRAIPINGKLTEQEQQEYQRLHDKLYGKSVDD